MAKVIEGKKAPNFKLRDKDGNYLALADLDNEFVVVYFYPKDDTPGCTIEATGFSKKLKSFEMAGAAVIGISGGDDASKAKFCTKHKLKLTLLSDPDFKVATAYEAYGDKQFMGKKFKGILRKTFLLDGKGKVLKIFEKVTPEGHAQEVLSAINEAAGRE